MRLWEDRGVLQQVRKEVHDNTWSCCNGQLLCQSELFRTCVCNSKWFPGPAARTRKMWGGGGRGIIRKTMMSIGDQVCVGKKQERTAFACNFASDQIKVRCGSLNPKPKTQNPKP